MNFSTFQLLQSFLFRRLISAKVKVAIVKSIVTVLLLHATAATSLELLGGDAPLSPEDAFVATVQSPDSQSLQINFNIATGYYLYRDKLKLSLHKDALAAKASQPLSAVLQSPTFSEAEAIDDEYFGRQYVFRESANLSVPYTSPADFENAILAVKFQGCADLGICYPPTTTYLKVAIHASSQSASAVTATRAGDSAVDSAVDSAGEGAVDSAGEGAAESVVVPIQSEQDRLFDFLGQNSLWLNVITFFGLGLLLAFTPCVLPMIPILSSMIVGQGESMSTSKAFRLSLVYVLVMASTYAIVGVIVGLSGYNVQAFLQNPWVLSAIAALFVVLSLSMFGLYELQMPSGVQARLSQWSNKQSSGQLSGVAAMGFISTLIVGPCVTAPLAGALIYIAKTGDALIGGVALFSLGLGMGAPLLLIGTSAGKLVPKAGAWMNATKQVFGVLMLAMAIYMLSRVLPDPVTMSLYAVLAIMSGVYWGATDSINQDTGCGIRLKKGVGIIITVYGLALFVAALAGGNSYTTPLKGVMTDNLSVISTPEKTLSFQQIKGLGGLQLAVRQASAAGQTVMLDFYADWCISCKEMDALTFSNPQVQTLLKDTMVIQADVTANDVEDQALLKTFDLFGPPGIIFYNPKGVEIPAARIVGYMPAEKFKAHLKRYIQTEQL